MLCVARTGEACAIDHTFTLLSLPLAGNGMYGVAEGKLRFLRFAALDRDPGQRDPGILV